MPNPLKNSRGGFSLIEVLIVVIIAASIVLVVSNLSGNVSSLNGLISRELQSKSNTDQILQLVTTDIRSASVSANGAYPIVSAASSSFVFYSDGGNGGIVKRVRYYLASSTIFRGITQPTGTPAIYDASNEMLTNIIDGVSVSTSTPLFRYYDSAYTGTQAALSSTLDVTPIRVVGVAFLAAVQSGQTSTLQAFTRFIDIRNLRSN